MPKHFKVTCPRCRLVRTVKHRRHAGKLCAKCHLSTKGKWFGSYK